MNFRRKEVFGYRPLTEIGSEAGETPERAEYASFCIEYEGGERRKAFITLGRFISSLERAPYEPRRRFVSWLMSRTYKRRENISRLIPHPLRARILEPTLLEWAEIEPENSEPHRWMGGYEHLKRAVDLQPDDEIARRELVLWILNRVAMNAHEIPAGYGYMGVPEEGLCSLAEADTLTSGLPSPEERAKTASEIAVERALIFEYLRRKGQAD
jgi:hypothetical protein